MVLGILKLENFIYFLNDNFLVLSLIILLLFILTNINKQVDKKNLTLTLNLSVYIYILYILLTINKYINFWNIDLWQRSNIKNYSLIFNSLYNIDITIDFWKIIIAIFAIVIFIIGIKFFENQYQSILVEYIYFLNFLMLGLVLFINSRDLIYMYILIEFISLLTYILIIYNKYSNYASEASLKYFILSSLSSCFLLFGIALFYSMLGSTEFIELQKIFLNFQMNKDYFIGYFISTVFIVFGFLFKLGVFPFHIWVPDVYQGTSYYFTMILTTVPKLSILLVLTKIIYILLWDIRFLYNNIWFFCAFGCFTIGVFGSFLQTNLKRLWAYSAIANMGFVFCNLINLTFSSIFGTVFYFLIYSILSLNFFFILIICIKYRSGFYLETIKQLSLIYKNYRLLAYGLCISFFSFIGIPPLAGFFTKLIVFQNLINSNEYILLFVVILFTVLSAFYYLRIIRKLFFAKKISSVFLQKNTRYFSILFLQLNAFNLLFIFQLPLITYYINKTIYYIL